MNTSTFGVSVCRYCQYYKAEGRRGGQCQQFGAQVQSGWKACALAIPPFAPTWEGLEEVFGRQDGVWTLSEVPSTSYSLQTKQPVSVSDVA